MTDIAALVERLREQTHTVRWHQETAASDAAMIINDTLCREAATALAEVERERDAWERTAEHNIEATRTAEREATAVTAQMREACRRAEAAEATVASLKAVIAWANNSLHGSHGFFLSLNGGPDDEHHLDRPIEELKEYGRKQWLRAEALAARVSELTASNERLREEARDKAYRIGILLCDPEWQPKRAHLEGCRNYFAALAGDSNG